MFIVIFVAILAVWAHSIVIEHRQAINKNMWQVEVRPAKVREPQYWSDLSESNYEITVAIKTRGTRESMVIEVLDIRRENFDEKLSEARAKAEERASTLNAVRSEYKTLT